jgi:hypothetical protein
MQRHSNGVRVAIVGATGAVGTELLLGDLHLVASARGAALNAVEIAECMYERGIV